MIMSINHIISGVPRIKTNLKSYNTSDAASLNAGSSKVYTFTPPSGYIWEIVAMQVHTPAPVGAASGTHKWMIQIKNILTLYGESDYLNEVFWGYSHWKTANVSKLPVDESAALIALMGCIYTKEAPLVLTYINSSNVATDRSRWIQLIIKESSII